MINHGEQHEQEILDFKSPIKVRFPKVRLKKHFENKYKDLSHAERGAYDTLKTDIELAINQLNHLKSIVELLLNRQQLKNM